MLLFLLFHYYFLDIMPRIRAGYIAPYRASKDASWKLKIIEKLEEISSAYVKLCCCKSKENLQTHWPLQQVL
jgi:hypothetical protein